MFGIGSFLGLLGASKNLQPLLAGRKVVFENRRILGYLRITESGLTPHPTRIEVLRGTLLLFDSVNRYEIWS